MLLYWKATGSGSDDGIGQMCVCGGGKGGGRGGGEVGG